MFGVIALMFLKLPPMAAKQDSVINTYSALVEVDALARQQFVQAIRDDRLVEGAIRGLLLQLDPYSGYLSPEELPSFERRNRGHFDSVGIEVGFRDGNLVVIAPIEGSPAAREGVLAGDLLVSIDGNDLKHRSVFDVEEMLVGAQGTSVRVELQHPGDAMPRSLMLTRGPVSLASVHGFRRDEENRWDFWVDRPERIGYIRVSGFRENTCTDFDEVIRPLRSGGLRGLILDLRFNPGGFMHQAVALADRFLSDGLIVSTVTRRNAVDEYRAVPDAIDLDVPLVILINAASASSSEIVAGALQARGRAVIVGERSFGKGSVQHLIPLIGQKSAIKLTVAHYRLPDGRVIHRTADNAASDAWGVRPDIEVELTRDETLAIQESRRLIDAPAATINKRIVESATSSTAQSSSLVMDRQLAAAVRVLRQRMDGGDGKSN